MWTDSALIGWHSFLCVKRTRTGKTHPSYRTIEFSALDLLLISVRIFCDIKHFNDGEVINSKNVYQSKLNNLTVFQ